jgi:hypothetical protein
METNNKDRKYDSERARLPLIKKTNVSDKVTLFTKVRSVISAIKAKHLN